MKRKPISELNRTPICGLVKKPLSRLINNTEALCLMALPVNSDWINITRNPGIKQTEQEYKPPLVAVQGGNGGGGDEPPTIDQVDRFNRPLPNGADNSYSRWEHKRWIYKPIYQRQNTDLQSWLCAYAGIPENRFCPYPLSERETLERIRRLEVSLEVKRKNKQKGRGDNIDPLKIPNYTNSFLVGKVYVRPPTLEELFSTSKTVAKQLGQYKIDLETVQDIIHYVRTGPVALNRAVHCNSFFMGNLSYLAFMDTYKTNPNRLGLTRRNKYNPGKITINQSFLNNILCNKNIAANQELLTLYSELNRRASEDVICLPNLSLAHLNAKQRAVRYSFNRLSYFEKMYKAKRENLNKIAESWKKSKPKYQEVDEVKTNTFNPIFSQSGYSTYVRKVREYGEKKGAVTYRHVRYSGCGRSSEHYSPYTHNPALRSYIEHGLGRFEESKREEARYNLATSYHFLHPNDQLNRYNAWFFNHPDPDKPFKYIRAAIPSVFPTKPCVFKKMKTDKSMPKDVIHGRNAWNRHLYLWKRYLTGFLSKEKLLSDLSYWWNRRFDQMKSHRIDVELSHYFNMDKDEQTTSSGAFERWEEGLRGFNDDRVEPELTPIEGEYLAKGEEDIVSIPPVIDKSVKKDDDEFHIRKTVMMARAIDRSLERLERKFAEKTVNVYEKVLKEDKQSRVSEETVNYLILKRTWKELPNGLFVPGEPKQSEILERKVM